MSPYTHALYITHYITLEVLSVTIPLVLSKTFYAFIYAFSRHFYPKRHTIAIQTIHVLGE